MKGRDVAPQVEALIAAAERLELQAVMEEAFGDFEAVASARRTAQECRRIAGVFAGAATDEEREHVRPLQRRYRVAFRRVMRSRRPDGRASTLRPRRGRTVRARRVRGRTRARAPGRPSGDSDPEPVAARLPRERLAA